jgi:hypothetical protein
LMKEHFLQGQLAAKWAQFAKFCLPSLYLVLA